MADSVRECGECTVCCVYPKIPILKKEGMVKCVNLLESKNMFSGDCKNNCKIYPKRPITCKNYKCAWLIGHGNEEDRPDKSNMLFDNSKRIPNSLECKPLKEGVTETLEGKEIIERMSKSNKTPVIVLSYLEHRISRLVGKGL